MKLLDMTMKQIRDHEDESIFFWWGDDTRVAEAALTLNAINSMSLKTTEIYFKTHNIEVDLDIIATTEKEAEEIHLEERLEDYKETKRALENRLDVIHVNIAEKEEELKELRGKDG